VPHVSAAIERRVLRRTVLLDQTLIITLDADQNLVGIGARSEPLAADEQAKFEELARTSLAAQAELEQNEVGDFDVFVGSYQASILAISN